LRFVALALTKNEYTKLCKVSIPADAPKSLQIAKHVFLFSCETALRYSDVMDLRWEHIDKEMKYLRKKQVKTGKEVYIPLSNIARSLIIVYKDKPKGKNAADCIFPYICNQVLNYNLKKVAELAEIEKNISSHVGRSTFATRKGATGDSCFILLIF